MRFDDVDFGTAELKTVNVRALSITGAKLELRVGAEDGPVIARVNLEAAAEWRTVRSTTINLPKGRNPLFVKTVGSGTVEVDWVSFE